MVGLSFAVRRRLASVVVAALMVVGTSAPALAAPDSRSTEFWLTFNENWKDPMYAAGANLSVFIAAETAATGTVSVPGIGFSAPFSVSPGAVATVNVPMGAMLSGLHSVQDRGVLVEATGDVTVYGLNREQYTTDAFLGLPTDVLGTDHLVMSYQNKDTLAPSQFAVVGTEPGTTVTITPTADGPGRPAGVPYTVMLNPGQVWQGGATGATADITGTSITSDKPVAVFGSHRCTNVPSSRRACDHLVEQLPPTSAWGESFVTAPLATRLNGDTFRILAAEDATQVSVNGVSVATLNRGQFHERIITGAATITSTAPVLVAQFSNGADYDGRVADPFMMLIPPYEQFLGEYTVATPATGFQKNFINVVAPTAAVGSILRNGVAIPASSFAPVGSSGFSAAQLSVAAGTHRLMGSLPFGVFVYGYDAYDSYGYPGGASFAPIAVATDLALTPATASRMVGEQHCVTATVTDQNSAALEGIRVDFQVAGANASTGFDATDAAGEAEYCYTGTNAGSDSLTASAGSLSRVVSADWRADAAPTVDAGPDVAGNEGTAIALAGTQNDDFGATSAWSATPLGADAGATCSFGDASAADTTITCTDDGTFRATLTADDGVNPAVSDSTVVTVANTAPRATVVSPVDGGEFVRGSAVPLEATFTDGGSNDTHDCTVDWGDGTSSAGTVDQAAGTCSSSHAYAVAGAYTITTTVTDDDGGADTDAAEILVGEPDGKITGGGHLTDAAGDRLSFGLNAASSGGASRGQLQLRSADARFHGDTVRDMIVFGNAAQWAGDGRWNGAPATYRVRVTDAASDTLQVTIRDADGAVVYDAGGALEGGQITIHR